MAPLLRTVYYDIVFCEPTVALINTDCVPDMWLYGGAEVDSSYTVDQTHK